MESASLAMLTGRNGEQKLVMAAFVVSLMCHCIFFAIMVYAQTHRPRQRPAPVVMNVSLVSLPEYAGPSQPSKPKTTVRKKPAKKKVTVKQPPSPQSKKKSAPKTIKKKTSLKKKTYRSEKVKKSTLKKLEKKVETSASDQIAKAIDKIKAKVDRSTERTPGKETATQTSDTKKIGGDGPSKGGKLAEIIDIYRVEIAYQVQQNWAFSHQLARGEKKLEVRLQFKVLPNGEIRDLSFTDRSGNRYLDESAYRAIMKSNPVKPHPTGLIAPYVHMGLRFTPEGVR